MNGGPYRSAPQPDDRRVINRSGPVSAGRSVEESQYRAEPDKSSVQRTAVSRKPESTPKKRSNWAAKTIVTLLIIIAIVLGGWFAWSAYSKSTNYGIDNSKYQAIFLTNGQIYFGKLHAFNDESFRLTTGYVAQAKTETTSGDSDDADTETSGGIVLIRLANETYGPENELFISKQQILHYENLKADSQYAKLIDQNEKSR